MKIKRTGIWLVLAAVMLLLGMQCRYNWEATPDEQAIRTQAVQTAVAQMTVQAALNPTATRYRQPSHRSRQRLWAPRRHQAVAADRHRHFRSTGGSGTPTPHPAPMGARS